MILLSISDLKDTIVPIPKYTASKIKEIVYGRHLKTSELLEIEGIGDYNNLNIFLDGGRAGTWQMLTLGWNTGLVICEQWYHYDIDPSSSNESVETTLQNNVSVIDDVIFPFNDDSEVEYEIGIGLSYNNGGGPKSRSVNPDAAPKVVFLTLEEFANYFNINEDPVTPPTPPELEE